MATYSYLYDFSDFPNNKVSPDRLKMEIESSEITVALDRIDLEDTARCLIYFKAELSDEEENVLNGVVANHTGEPLVDHQYVKAEILADRIDNIVKNPLKEVYEARSYVMDIDSSFNDMIIKWPYDIILISGTVYVTSEMVGDSLELLITPNTLIGSLDSSLSVGDTSCYVSDSALANAGYGDYLNIYTEEEDSHGVLISRIKEVVPEENKVVFLEPTDVSANAGTLLSKTIKMLPHVYFANESNIDIGKNITSGLRLSSGASIHIHYYTESTDLPKKAAFFLEYLY